MLFRSKFPILGVCLGMQAIALYSGAEIYNLKQVKHGVSENIIIQEASVLFEGLPEKFHVGLYHSWAVRTVPGCAFGVTAVNKDGVVMAIEDTRNKLFGVQFHPESILTDHGKIILKNFLQT